ncbi:hypothetical protein DFH27DRAFT_604944 [Peziza echinospora]|nr:hypothetical protein DFH27DRAFT_604944 [Peziza echinospora]
MKPDGTRLDTRKVQKEFVDGEGKMWRITSVDVTPDPGKDPLSKVVSEPIKESYSAENSDWEDRVGKGIENQGMQPGVVTKGWKVFFVESVFPAPVGVDWPPSDQTSKSMSRTSTFGLQDSKSTTSRGTFSTSDFKKPTSAGNSAVDVRRMSIPEEAFVLPEPVVMKRDMGSMFEGPKNDPYALMQSETMPQPLLGNDEFHGGGDLQDIQPMVSGLGGAVPEPVYADTTPQVDLPGVTFLADAMGGGMHSEVDGHSSTVGETTKYNSREQFPEERGSGPSSLIPASQLSWASLGAPPDVISSNYMHRSDTPLHEIQVAPSAPVEPVKSKQSLDWTRGEMDSEDGQLRDYYSLLREIPWYAYYALWAALGMASTVKIFLQLYNLAWTAIAQERHPQILGVPFEEGWPELKLIILPLIRQCFIDGIIDEPLYIDRQVPQEECYFHFHIGPLIGDDESPEGVMEQAFERTSAVLNTRRMNTMQHIIEASEVSRDLREGDYWRKIIDAFATNPNDIPFALIYLRLEEDIYYLEGSLGVPVGTPVAPLKVQITEAPLTGGEPTHSYRQFGNNHHSSSMSGSSSAPSVPMMMVTGEHDTPGESSRMTQHEDNLEARRDYLFAREMHHARVTGSMVYKDLTTLSPEEKSKLDGIEYRGFHEPCTGTLITPIQPTAMRNRGFMIIGLNPRRPFDNPYENWLQQITDHVSTTVAREELLTEDFQNAIDAELALAERRKGIELRDRLVEATEQLKDSELMFTKFAESIPIGITILDERGGFVFLNDAYRSTCEFRVGKSDEPDPKRPWKKWVMKTIEPDKRNNRLRGFFATLVDITSIKLAAEYQKELKEQAIENERRQESFIDITSHEMRNPLSAVLQSAESILADMVHFQKSGGKLDVEAIIDSARTILLCVNHQTRIIEDILTVSKLDAMLLTVVPVEVQMTDLLSKSLKMFEDELKRKGIKCSLTQSASYGDLKVDWVYADPSRVTQLLVNLTTNAIKFTALVERERYIRVSMEAATEPPGSTPQRAFLPIEEEDTIEDVTANPDWGNGEVLYIVVSVEDNGLGIKKEWQDQLFQRFKQAPKTHVTYGGSGLGLFICKKLCHVQGGNIAVYSEEGKGSTFTFYIKTTRAEAPIPTAPARTQSWPEKVAEEAQKLADTATPPESDQGSIKQAARAGLSTVTPVPESEEETDDKKVVLVVEDNLINQRVLQQQLSKEGFKVLVSNNGKESYDMILNSQWVKKAETPNAVHVDIVLMDMEMPIMDGTAATRLIRALEADGKTTGHVPILGISANARPEQQAQMVEAGMDASIAKPFRIPDLINRFDSLIEESKRK